MFATIDTWLIRQHQKIANWSDVRYDKNCYWWGYVITEVVCVLAPALIVFLLIAFLESETAEHTVLASFIVVLFIVFSALMITLEFQSRKQRLKEVNSRVPILKGSNQFWRLMYCFLTCVEASDLFKEFSGTNMCMFLIFVCFTSRSYFDVCLPLPPSEKERKQAEKFSGVPEAA